MPAPFYYIFNQFTWRIAVKDRSIFLTFDDGPNEEVTSWILDTLDKYNAKATFFCVGENVEKYPKAYREILERGHNTGNHTYNHFNSRDYSDESYIKNVEKASELIKSPLFRPPYGRIRPRLAKKLRHLGFKPVLWTVLSYDFDAELTPGFIFRKIVRQSRPGSIIVFHDNIKAYKNLQILLPRYLAFFSNKGYRFRSIPLRKSKI